MKEILLANSHRSLYGGYFAGVWRGRLKVSRAFSLIEVLLAIFILGIGMIMVASVFPVGANWTRQTTEESVAQTIAQDAMSVIRAHYGPGGDLSNPQRPGGTFTNPVILVGSRNTILASSNPLALQALPGFSLIPTNERSYQFGARSPFPAGDPLKCTYFWTALARLNPSHYDFNPAAPPLSVNGIFPSTTYKYDIFVLVFRKGAVENSFSYSTTEVVGTRNVSGMATFDNSLPDQSIVPSVCAGLYSTGIYDVNRSPAIYGATPALGGIGIGQYTGTVFRQIVDAAGTGAATPRPLLLDQRITTGANGTVITSNPQEPVIYSAPADGSTVSPLIYVYQTTLTF